MYNFDFSHSRTPTLSRPRIPTRRRKTLSESGNVVVNLLLVVVALLLIGGAVYGTYTWQHKKVKTLTQQVAQLKSNVTTNQKSSPSSPAPTANSNSTSTLYTSKKGVSVTVYTPSRDSQVNSPLVVMGQVPGSWSFEASFPVKLLDAQGNTIAQGPAQLQGDWMTDKLVPFTVKLTYTSAVSGKGSLELSKDNPSGLPANADSVTIPVQL